jgi:2-polyprenyl-6-methoxyphenol hydroxylase-like FAD-dependent oxidoreductase
MEDAWIVAETLATASDIPAAFLEFERKRKERIQSVARMAWMLGKAAHLNGPRRWLRNLAFRATPNAIARRQINALYKSLQIPSVK